MREHFSDFGNIHILLLIYLNPTSCDNYKLLHSITGHVNLSSHYLLLHIESKKKGKPRIRTDV